MSEELIELEAKVLEYEHALEHVAEDHEGACPSCQSLARGALDRVNKEGFEEIAKEGFDGITPEIVARVESCARRLATKLSPGEIVLWFICENSYLDDETPLDCIMDDPARLREAVLGELNDGP